MKRVKDFAIYLTLGILIAIGAFFFSTFWKERVGGNVINIIKAAPTDADLRLRKINYTQTRGALKQWEIEAETANYFKERNLALFKNIKVTCFPENGGRITLESEEGELNTDTQIIHLQGQVMASSEEGYQFRTNSLNFNLLENKIFTSAAIELAGSKLEVRGQGLMLNLDDETLRVNHVRSLIRDFNLNEAWVK